MNASTYEALLAYRRQTATLESCAAILGWDQETCMPKRGAELRAEQLALLAGMAHRRKTAQAYRDLLEAAEEQEPESPAAANLREARRESDLAVKVPPELVEEITRVSTLARPAWVEARDGSDFALFLPWLEKIVDLSRRKADALGHAGHPYDALLDIYEPGETTVGIEQLFGPLRERLVDLVARILASGHTVKTAALHRTFPIASQKSFARRAAEAIGFDFTRGRVDVTAHPFCSGAGPLDVRLTTRYSEDFFSEAFFGLLHEAGHGIYEQGLLVEHWGTPMGEACSLGIHESQSRMWENLVGRSRGFWRYFLPALKETFPDAVGDTELEEFYRAINEVRPSMIRVEADEVTYNLHIFLRFELEQALIGGDLKPADVPGAWNETFQRFLQVEVPDDRRGCLQDIHWAMGGMGYFPTYTLGNLYAAQIFESAQEELGDLESRFASGEFAPLRNWLNNKIHREGSRLQPRRLIEAVTGSAPSHEPLLRHLESKYGEIYDL